MRGGEALLRSTGVPRDGHEPPRGFEAMRGRPRWLIDPVSVGLWVFMGVATALFSLFLFAYVMRIAGGDAAAIAWPKQVWLSTALLALAGIAMQRAARTGPSRDEAAARRALIAGGLLAMAFIGVQLWTWSILSQAQVRLNGNPMGSFFYLLSAMHGLHVLGGLAGWAVAVHAAARGDDARAARLARLCARYWHFLLFVWVVLFAALAGITPELAARLCGVQ
jgi:cytochrome c oxidase subunit 3